MIRATDLRSGRYQSAAPEGVFPPQTGRILEGETACPTSPLQEGAGGGSLQEGAQLREGSGVVADAILADEGLTERQKQVLLEIYDSFRKENADVPSSSATGTTTAPAGAAEPLATAPAPVKKKTATPQTKAPAKRTAAKTTASGGTS